MILSKLFDLLCYSVYKMATYNVSTYNDFCLMICWGMLGKPDNQECPTIVLVTISCTRKPEWAFVRTCLSVRMKKCILH